MIIHEFSKNNLFYKFAHLFIHSFSINGWLEFVEYQIPGIGLNAVGRAETKRDKWEKPKIGKVMN